MQKLLNTPHFALSPLWLRTFSNVKTSLSAVFALLLLTVLSNPVMAAGFNGNSVIISGTGTNTANGTYDVSAFSNTTTLKALGTFDRGTNKLYLGAQSNTTESGNETVNSVQMLYRVYLAGSSVTATFPSFTALPLSTAGTSKAKTWNSVNSAELVGITGTGGSYVLEFFFQLNYSDNRNSAVLIADNNSNKNYKAAFTVSGTQPVTWNGSAGDGDWSTAKNWTPNTVPTATTDATIPFILGGGKMSYPTVSRGIAQVRTLSIMGNNGGTGGRNFIQGGELQVFGNFLDPNNGFGQTGGVFVLAGNTAQTFDGASFTDIRVQGGSIKTLSNRMDVSNSLAFANSSGGGIISTRTDNSLLYSVDLGTTASISGESENSYVSGFLRTPFRYVLNGVLNSFGNIGVDLTANGGIDPGVTLVTRLTGVAYTGVGVKGSSVKRSFTFTPDNPDNLNFTLVFHYLNTELNGNGTNLNNLSLERSLTGAAPYENLGSKSNSALTVTRPFISGTLAATFTIADETVNPLPVTLISFTATPTAQGAALLRWATATESNNRGFGIERQLGVNEAWQSVGFVAAGATTGSTYEFMDKSLVNAPASAQAYYRLRQEDLDAKVTYSPVAVINRTAAVAATELTLSPVPVSGTDNLSVGLAEAGQAGIVVAVVNTQGQRMMSFTTQASTDAALSLPVTSLAAGVYIVTVQVPGQAVRHARFVKL